MLFVQGTQGCKNIKLGGDTVHGESSEGWNVFMTYFVYRSLKFPPGDKRQKWNLVYINVHKMAYTYCWHLLAIRTCAAQPWLHTPKKKGLHALRGSLNLVSPLYEHVSWQLHQPYPPRPTQHKAYYNIIYINRSIQKAFPASLYRYTSI